MEETLSEEEVEKLGQALIEAVPIDSLNDKQRELFSVMLQGYSHMGEKLEIPPNEALQAMQMLVKAIQAQLDQMNYYLKNRA